MKRPRPVVQPVAVPSPPPDFAARVVAWQRQHGRHGLPWQGTRDAYRIWLSEIMLQQTQVSTVLRYYGRFLERFPTVVDLASASVDDVLALWSGLGYYSRARNLHACAQAVLRCHGGEFPRQAELLEALPGIGRSTAAAVAAFSSGQRRAILDGNVKRVLARHRAFAEDISTPAAQRALWALAESLLPEEGGMQAYTQGLMDLGATVCLLRRPRCSACPLQTDCVAHARGQPQDFPLKTRRLKRSAKSSVLLMALKAPEVRSQPWQVLLQQRPDRGIWAGLWTLPMWEEEAALEQAVGAGGLAGDGLLMERLPTVHHALTHLDWALHPRLLVLPASGGLPGHVVGADTPEQKAAWVPMPTALASGLPAPIRRLLEDFLATRRTSETGGPGASESD